MAQNQLDLNSLSKSLSDGITAGTAQVVSSFAASAESSRKVTELDKEVGLVKGYLTSLIGATADGSTGMVPRLERDMQELKTDMTTVKSEVRELKVTVDEMGKNIKTIMEAQADQASWMAGWRGVGVAIGIAATCITIIGGIVAAIIWLYRGH